MIITKSDDSLRVKVLKLVFMNLYLLDPLFRHHRLSQVLASLFHIKVFQLHFLSEFRLKGRLQCFEQEVVYVDVLEKGMGDYFLYVILETQTIRFFFS